MKHRWTWEGANAAAEAKTDPTGDKESITAAGDTVVKGKQTLQSKPQCDEGEVLRQGECIKLEKPENKIAIGGKYLPPLEAATTTAAIATVATVSALSQSLWPTGCSS